MKGGFFVLCGRRVHLVGVDLQSTRAAQAAKGRRADEDIRPYRCGASFGCTL